MYSGNAGSHDPSPVRQPTIVGVRTARVRVGRPPARAGQDRKRPASADASFAVIA